MGRLVFLAVFGMLCFFSTSFSANIERLMDNVVVLRVQESYGSKENVPISCKEGLEDHMVTWRKDGVLQPELQGNHITVTVQEWNGGYYSCHLGPEEPQINYTVVMIQLEPDNRTVILEPRGHENDYIHCSALNYRGRFHCRWSKSKIRSGANVMLVKAHRNHEPVTCVMDPNGSGMTCEDNTCPYKEEQHHISLELYMNSVYRLERYTKTFYLRDIVTPERLPNLHLLSDSVFKWDYPDSWDKPCSYFSLRFHVKVVRNGENCDSREALQSNTTSLTEYKVDLKKKRYVFCVRAQDMHTEGPWSHWSHYIVNRSAAD